MVSRMPFAVSVVAVGVVVFVVAAVVVDEDGCQCAAADHRRPVPSVAGGTVGRVCRSSRERRPGEACSKTCMEHSDE